MSSELDRLKKALFGLMERALQRVDYYALYPAKVIKQASNGTLELQPEDVRLQALLPGLTSVPIRYGLPGVKVEIPAGGRVALGFEGGNPQQPVVVFWDSSAVTRLDIAADKIYLGAPTGTQEAVLGQTLQAHLSAQETHLNATVAALVAWAGLAIVRINLAVTVPPAAPAVPALVLSGAPATPNVKATKVEVK